ncbi:MAG: HEAT repeat domain-containing protein, partial [Planctomycetota bacterium]
MPPVIVRAWFAVALLPLLLADEATDARFKRLRADLERVRKSANWMEIKERRDLVEALGDLDHPGVEKVLYTVFAEDREQLCRIPAMVGLGKRASFPALKAMVTAAIRDSNELYRMCLPLALARSSNPEIGPWLVKHILPMNQDRVLRAAVIESLGHLRSAEAYEPIRRILSRGGDVRIAYESLIALARIGGARSIGVLLPVLDHENPVLREGAVTALALSRHPGAIEIVPKMVADTDVRVREAVAGLVLALRADDGIPAVIDFLRSGRLRLMETSRQVLKELSGEDYGHDPDAWEHWYGRKKT